jgi:hypothetical protein
VQTDSCFQAILARCFFEFELPVTMATSQQAKTSNAISLKGSADIVAEFFGYGINSILYQVKCF